MAIHDGGSDVQAMVSLLSDPVRLKEEYDRLEAERARAAEIVALVGPANEIKQLREEADVNLSMAQRTKAEADRMMQEAESFVEVAKAKAERAYKAIVEDAQHNADRILNAAKGEAEALFAKAQTRAAELEAQAEVLLAREREIMAAAVAAENAAAEAKALRERAEAELEAANQTKLKFEAALKTVEDAVASMQEKLRVRST